MDLSYIINELGEERARYFNAVAPPILQTSNFSSPTVADMREALRAEAEVSFYTRGNNPTTSILEKKIAALEGAERALAFGSGMAAVSAAVMSQVRAGDHIVSVQRPYSWTNALLQKLLPRFGVETTVVDGTDPENFRRAIQPKTKVLYLESPNSFTFELQDLEAISLIAKEHGLRTIIDNSYASPLCQQPASLGIDIVVHSATKYIGGHSDTMGGIVCSTREIIAQIFRSEFMTLGGVLSPHDAWLLIRGLRTLPLRMERIARTTQEVVAYLEGHPKVARVLFPFLPSHPQYALAQKQMRSNAGLFSLLLRTEQADEVDQFCDSLRHFLMAASWGGHESLIFPVSAITRVGGPKPTLPVNLIRFYIGLEEGDYLIRDLEQAFARI